MYRQRVEEVVAALTTNAQRGLSENEARARLEHDGRNELASQPPIPTWRRILAQFQDVLVILLLVATAISTVLWVYEREEALPYEAIAILAVVLLNAAMGYIQEARAEAGRQRRCGRCQPQGPRVIRDGERRSIPAALIVPGDLILIGEGDTIPADTRLIESVALQTAEAALTGESLPVSKDTNAIEGEVGIGDRTTWCSAAPRSPTDAGTPS